MAASTNQAKGQVTVAVKLLEHVVRASERLAEDHPDRLASQNALAGAYRANGQVTKAVEVLEHVSRVKQGMLHVGQPNRKVSKELLASMTPPRGPVIKQDFSPLSSRQRVPQSKDKVSKIPRLALRPRKKG
ncbi:hypothetical protein LTR17_027457 [Elasticomyces elasticus]|nr:hypothetical protein LTR17_027457 [Elasticomyces elasticus]